MTETAMLLALALPAFAFDHGHAALQEVLDGARRDGRVDYAALKAAPTTLDTYLREVAAAPMASMSAPQKKAFLINAYNALTLDLVADNYPLKSIMDLDGGKVWDTRRFPVGGQQLTLNDIEHKLLRPLGDPRIHAAVNCASIGCPPLAPKVFTAEALDAQLDTASKRWAATARLTDSTVVINQIFDWYGDDFLKPYGASYHDIPGIDGKAEAALNFIAKYAPDKAERLKAGNVTVTYGDYDWALNRRP